jgi:hypothetical protein
MQIRGDIEKPENVQHGRVNNVNRCSQKCWGAVGVVVLMMAIGAFWLFSDSSSGRAAGKREPDNGAYFPG